MKFFVFVDIIKAWRKQRQIQKIPKFDSYRAENNFCANDFGSIKAFIQEIDFTEDIERQHE